MNLVSSLVCFGLRQVLDVGADEVVAAVEQHFADHGQTLTRALSTANEKAWKALGIALAGDGFITKVKIRFTASGDEKGFREQVRRFLDGKGVSFDGSPADFRQDCLTELNRALKTNLLSVEGLSAKEIARGTADFRRYTDPHQLLQPAEDAVARVAEALAPEYPNLARLLGQPTPGGPPLLVSIFCYFFRREVETDDELAHGLFFDGLRQLTGSQAKAFGEVNKALATLGVQFDALLEQVGRIEVVVVETHGAVLDLQVELQRLGGLHLANADEVRSLLVQVQQHLGQIGMQRGEVRPQHSFSIHGEDERRAVKALLARFRHLPPAEQQQMPALLNGLGKLQVGAGDFPEARRTFTEVVAAVSDPSGKAEAAHNVYRAALEERKWEGALQALQQAASLDPGRFAPFPLHRYEPKRILGAGGFGTAVLCLDRHFDEEVVVKTLHAADLERGLDDVFREARTLRRLSHPAIIGVLDCEYAEPAAKGRPYIVMDYFSGNTLEDQVQKHGPLAVADLLDVAIQVARGMQAAHGHGVLHRDVKPANVLVRKEGDGWLVKVIDFGLALRKQVVETSMAVRSAGNTVLSDSVAGSLKYAPPEQMGDIRGVKAGRYSDVYSFGKMCCHTLFRTTEPKSRHWAGLPKELVEMLERCTEQELEHRHADFGPVLAVLEVLALARREAEAVTAGRQQEEARRQAEEQQRSEQEEAVRQQQELARLPKKEEAKLPQVVRADLDRTTARPTEEDTAVANALARLHRTTGEFGNPIGGEVLGKREQNRPQKPGPGEALAVALGSGVEMKFAWIPPGNFLMGSPEKEERDNDETQHGVTLTKGFHLGIHPVTRGQFTRFVQATGYATHAEREGGAYYWTGSEWKLDPQKNWRNPGFEQTDHHPVVCLSWHDSVALCEWLTTQDGESRRYRLPTEAEWEYSCRARTTTPFHFGERIGTDRANYDGNHTYGKGKKGVFRKKTTPVGSFPANTWGLFDMHGNVWEWCQDWFDEYPKKYLEDPQGPTGGTTRVLRGGSWCFGPWGCRSAYRYRIDPGLRNDANGCRVLLCLD